MAEIWDLTHLPVVLHLRGEQMSLFYVTHFHQSSCPAWLQQARPKCFNYSMLPLNRPQSKGEKGHLGSGTGCGRTWVAFPLCLSLITVLRVYLQWSRGALRLCAESRVSASSKATGYTAPGQQKHLHEGSDPHN